jgi:hypothetical protein
LLSQPIIDVDMPYKSASRRVEITLGSSRRPDLASLAVQTSFSPYRRFDGYRGCDPTHV